MRSTFTRVIAVSLAAFVAMPIITSSCATEDDAGLTASATDAGKKDVVNGKGGGGAPNGGGGPSGGGGTISGGGGTLGGGGGGGAPSGGGGSGATGGTGSGGGTGTCNPQTCPTPAPPAEKCCVTANGPCGVDYKQGAGCQAPSAADY